MLTRFSSWINTVNTTSFRIVVSTICTGLGLLMVVVAVLFFNWQPTEVQLKVLGGAAVVAMTVMGLDVTQFIGKRFSDSGYAAAKATPPVNVESANLVTASDRQPPAPIVVPPEIAKKFTIQDVPTMPHREPENGDDP